MADIEVAKALAPTTASVGVASAAAVAQNKNRRGLILTNLSANVITLGIGQAAVLNSGIALIANAQWIMEGFSFSQDTINAIATGAASNLAIQEFE